MKESSDGTFKRVSRSKGVTKGKSVEELLSERRSTIQSSEMFQDLKKHLEPHRNGICKIRCVAIGSFHEEFAALYQMALLLELWTFLGADRGNKIPVSVYDPVFTGADRALIETLGSEWSVDETVPWAPSSASEVLYFLPHAPLDLTERIVASENPRFWLANHISKHTDRYTKLQLHDKYPILSKLLNSLVTSEAPVRETDFQPFVSKRNRRKNKSKFQEPIIDYSSIDTHFSKCTVLTDFKDGDMLSDQPWINSFSDLALHLLD